MNSDQTGLPIELASIYLCIELITALSSTADAATRKESATKLHRLASSLEPPGESLKRILFQALQPAVCRIGTDLNLFEILTGSNGARTTEELSKETKCDPQLLSRILRFFASTNIITEIGEETFIANNITETLAKPALKAGMNVMFDTMGPAYQAMPQFMKETNYKNPDDASYTPFQLGHKTKTHFFDWLQENPEQSGYFMEFMTAQHEGKPIFLDVYPLAEEIEGIDPRGVTFVDIGGGIGHQCIALRTKFPELPGRVILQDQAATLEHALPMTNVELMTQDLFKPQGVKNAKYYYLRNVLHDWPDSKCQVILSNIRNAMGPDSLILIDEMVLPNSGTDAHAMSLDFTMMTVGSAAERTQKQWGKLFDSAGLRVCSTYTYTKELSDSIQVCVPK